MPNITGKQLNLSLRLGFRPLSINLFATGFQKERNFSKWPAGLERPCHPIVPKPIKMEHLMSKNRLKRWVPSVMCRSADPQILSRHTAEFSFTAFTWFNHLCIFSVTTFEELGLPEVEKILPLPSFSETKCWQHLSLKPFRTDGGHLLKPKKELSNSNHASRTVSQAKTTPTWLKCSELAKNHLHMKVS